ncbi:MAG: hypothetical protein QOF18_1353 [Frankiaceae bacterium]|jgi:hypothetical protein|nr:hypothetical protein [Frankiaceae bacterium]
MSTPEQPPQQAHIHLPDDRIEGSYADFVSVWHSRDVFVLDFAVLSQPTTTAQLASRVVSRVRIPPSQVFEIMKALEQQLTAWEAERDTGPGS